jgi:cytochrome P450
LPLLGIPGWHPANTDPAFYANTDYFRPQRRAPSVWAE